MGSSSVSGVRSRKQKEKPVGYIVLDFSAVQGLDTSAVLSLVKLRNYCEERDVTLVFSGLSDSMHAAFLGAGFFGTDRPHQAFPTRNDAVEWCEDMVLLYHEVGEASSHTFESWLQNELGGDITFERVEPYMTRRELDSGVVLFRQGEPSDSVVFQASGCVAITIAGEYGKSIRLRRMLGHTVVGEMGSTATCRAGRTWSRRARALSISSPASPSTRCRRKIRRPPPPSTSSSSGFCPTGWNSPTARSLRCIRFERGARRHIRQWRVSARSPLE